MRNLILLIILVLNSISCRNFKEPIPPNPLQTDTLITGENFSSPKIDFKEQAILYSSYLSSVDHTQTQIDAVKQKIEEELIRSKKYAIPVKLSEIERSQLQLKDKIEQFKLASEDACYNIKLEIDSSLSDLQLKIDELNESLK